MTFYIRVLIMTGFVNTIFVSFFRSMLKPWPCTGGALCPCAERRHGMNILWYIYKRLRSSFRVGRKADG